MFHNEDRNTSLCLEQSWIKRPNLLSLSCPLHNLWPNFSVLQLYQLQREPTKTQNLNSNQWFFYALLFSSILLTGNSISPAAVASTAGSKLCLSSYHSRIHTTLELLPALSVSWNRLCTSGGLPFSDNYNPITQQFTNSSASIHLNPSNILPLLYRGIQKWDLHKLCL